MGTVRILLGGLVCVLAAQQSSGAVVYSQYLANTNAGFSSNAHDQQIADSFSFSSPAVVSIRSVHFLGAYGVIPPSNTSVDDVVDNFRVVFLTDAAGMP